MYPEERLMRPRRKLPPLEELLAAASPQYNPEAAPPGEPPPRFELLRRGVQALEEAARTGELPQELGGQQQPPQFPLERPRRVETAAPETPPPDFAVLRRPDNPAPQAAPETLGPPPPPLTRPRVVFPQPEELMRSAPPGVEYDPAQSDTRDRLADPRAFVTKRIYDEVAHPYSGPNTNSRGWGAVKSGLMAAGDVLSRGGNLGNAIGAFAGGAGVGAFDKTLDERLAERRRTGQRRAALKEADDLAARGYELDAAKAGVRLRNAQAGLAEQRPELERERLAAQQRKADEQRIARGQQRVFRALQMRRGSLQPFDPVTNPTDAQLASDAAEFGVTFDPEMFGDKNAPTTATRLDPADETREIRMQFDRAARRWVPATDEAGEPFVTRRVEQRDERGVTVSTNERLAQMRQRFEQSERRFRFSMEQGLSARAAREFNLATRGDFQAARQARSELAKLEREKGAGKMRAGHYDAERQRLEGVLNDALGRIDSAREKFASSPASPAPAPAPASKGRVSRLKFDAVRAKYPALKGKSDAEVEAALRADGWEVY